MKIEIITTLLIFLAFSGIANEYTSLQQEKKELEQKIIQLKEYDNLEWYKKIWHFSPYQIWTRKKLLKQKEARFNEVKDRISIIKRKTTVFITCIELKGIPDFDAGKSMRGNADLCIGFQSRGPRNAFIFREKCGSNFISDIREKLLKYDVIEIKDQDSILGTNVYWEDMGQISCQDIFLSALENDFSVGSWKGQINTSKGSYSYIITYERE